MARGTTRRTFLKQGAAAGLALGAAPTKLKRMFVRQGLMLTAVGAGVGLVTAVALTQWMSSLLFGVERLDAHTEMIEIASLRSGCGAACPAKRATDRHEIDQRSAGAKLHEPDRIVAALDRASEHVAIEGQHAAEVGDAQHDVVDLANSDHGVFPHGIVPCLSSMGHRCSQIVAGL